MLGMNADQSIRDQVSKLLEGGMAHLKLQDEIEAFPFDRAATTVNGAPYNAWQLLEHIRIAQHDILEFSRSESHVSPSWPDGYWPENEAPRDLEEWNQSISQVLDDLEAMKKLVNNPAVDIHAKIPWGDGQTVLREALLVADHNAYHLGQLVMLRRMLDEE
jgi:DinB family protein